MKKLICAVIVCLFVFSFCGCDFRGYDWFDTNFHFTKAVVKMPDGSVETLDITTWADAEGEQLTITTKDGKRYLVSSVNCILLEE